MTRPGKLLADLRCCPPLITPCITQGNSTAIRPLSIDAYDAVQHSSTTVHSILFEPLSDTVSQSAVHDAVLADDDLAAVLDRIAGSDHPDLAAS